MIIPCPLNGRILHPKQSKLEVIGEKGMRKQNYSKLFSGDAA
jgi:hypothetical protein